MLAIWVIATVPFVFSALLIKERHNFIPFFVYLLMSLATFIVYAYDKTMAHKDEQRVSENTLHMLALLGGWPGALITQRLIRHKNKKSSFQMASWKIVIIHISVWIDVVLFNSEGIEPILCKFYSIC